MVKPNPPLAVTPTFTPEREVSPPLMLASSDLPSGSSDTVWGDNDIFQYLRSPTPSPVFAHEPSLPPSELNRPPTPMPALGWYTAQRLNAPPALATLDFVHLLPTQLPPYTRTSTMVTPNGKVEYFAYAGPDGVAHACMYALVEDLQAMHEHLTQSQRRGG